MLTRGFSARWLNYKHSTPAFTRALRSGALCNVPWAAARWPEARRPPQDRSRRLNDDVIYQLVHSKVQWGELTGCGDFTTPACVGKWHEIQDLVTEYARKADMGGDVNWGRSPPLPASAATAAAAPTQAAAGRALQCPGHWAARAGGSP